MKKVLLGTFVGFLFFIASLYVGYLAIEGMKQGGNPLFLIIAVGLFGVSIYLLYKAGRLDTFKSKIDPLEVPTQPAGKTLLEKNNKVAKEWEEASEKRDKLKILGVAGAVEEKK